MALGEEFIEGCDTAADHQAHPCLRTTCEPLANHAVYIWHCDALGRHSLYTRSVTRTSCVGWCGRGRTGRLPALPFIRAATPVGRFRPLVVRYEQWADFHLHPYNWGIA